MDNDNIGQLDFVYYLKLKLNYYFTHIKLLNDTVLYNNYILNIATVGIYNSHFTHVQITCLG